MIHPSDLVRDIALDRPGATRVFRSFKIDYCCNGALPLADAAAARGVELGTLQRALAALEVEARETPSDPPALIEHIVWRYHQVHMAEFPEAIRLARRVEAVHRDRDACPRGLADHLAIMADDLQAHQQKEEAVLFPMMLRGGGPMIGFPINRMMLEHQDVAEQLLHLAVITTDFTPPNDACTTRRALYSACAKIDADLREHMHLENNVLFPQFA